jgi:hypothetical protein
MYVSFVNDRKQLGYKAVKDTNCVMKIKLVLTTKSNFLLIKNIPSKVNYKTKRVIVVVCLGVALCFSNIQPSEAIGLSVLPASLVRVQPSYQHPYVSILDEYRPSGLYMTNFERSSLVSQHSQSLKLINELRAGGSRVREAAWLLITIWILQQQSVGFQPVNYAPLPPHIESARNLIFGKPNIDQFSCRRLSMFDSQLYAGSPTQSLKSEASRNQPNPKDRWFLVESRPELVMRRGQAQFKTKDHGALAGLPYFIKKNGGTSTLRTEKNVDVFTDVVEEIVENSNSIWFEGGTYQRGTTREVESINIYNEEKNRVAIFKRSTGEFITLCQPDEDEINDLMQTENFGGQTGWFSGQAKNLAPNQSSNGITPTNSFESDVLGVTLVDGSSARDWQI